MRYTVVYMDFVSDQSGRHLLRLSTLLEVPDYVKESSVEDEAIAPLTDAQFGIPHRREFPLDTPGHVYLSYGFCKSAGIQTSELMAKILKAGSFFAIDADLTKIDEAFDNLTKSASEGKEKQFALYIDFGEAKEASTNPGEKLGGVRGFYPIGSDFEVEQSAIKLANERSRIPVELFAEASRNLVKAAKEFSVPQRLLPRQVLNYGVERLPQADFLLKEAAARSATTGDTFYEEVAATAIENPEGVATHDYAELWVQADRQNGYKSASKHDLDPFMIFNSGPTVEAMERNIESWTVVAGAAVPVEKVATVKEADLNKWFAKPVAEKLSGIVKKAVGRVKGSELAVALGELEFGLQKAFLKHLAAS